MAVPLSPEPGWPPAPTSDSLTPAAALKSEVYLQKKKDVIWSWSSEVCQTDKELIASLIILLIKMNSCCNVYIYGRFDSRIMLNAVINWVKFISSPSAADAALCFRRWSRMRAKLLAIFQIMAAISCSTSSYRPPLLLPPADEALHYVQTFHVCGQK